MPLPTYDPTKDIAPDVYKVTWTHDRTHAVVAHFKSLLASKPCCYVEGDITDADRQHPHGAEIGLLSRLRMPCGVS